MNASSLNRMRVFLIAAIGWLMLQWTVSFTFNPQEFSIDLSMISSRSHLKENWKVIPSLAFKGVMDVSVSEAPGAIDFSLKEADTQYIRIKARLLDPKQELRISVNQHPWKNLKIGRKPGVQKWSGTVPAEILHSGENRITFESSTPAPVFIEKFSIRNYRSDPDISRFFIGLDQSYRGKRWLSIQWISFPWLLILALLLGAVEISADCFWNQIYRVRSELSTQKIIWTGFMVPLFLFFVFICISSFTPYLVLLTLPTYWMIWGAGILDVHLICELICLTRRALDQLAFFLEQSFLAAQTFSGRIPRWIGSVLFLGNWLLKNIKPFVQKNILNPSGAYRLYAGSMIIAAVCLIFQAFFYLLLVSDPAKIVDAHGAYPFLRKTAEMVADLGTLVLPIFVFVSFTDKNSLQ